MGQAFDGLLLTMAGFDERINEKQAQESLMTRGLKSRKDPLEVGQRGPEVKNEDRCVCEAARDSRVAPSR